VSEPFVDPTREPFFVCLHIKTPRFGEGEGKMGKKGKKLEAVGVEENEKYSLEAWSCSNGK